MYLLVAHSSCNADQQNVMFKFNFLFLKSSLKGEQVAAFCQSNLTSQIEERIAK
jgi:hypothetical protein